MADLVRKYGGTPFSEILATSGNMPTQAITKMRMLQDLGWPEARRTLKDDQGRSRIVKKNSDIWLLKCKPSCWRLYFYVCDEQQQQEGKRIIFVHAVCKKKDKEDPREAKEAERIAHQIRSGGSRITLFEFPTG